MQFARNRSPPPPLMQRLRHDQLLEGPGAVPRARRGLDFCRLRIATKRRSPRASTKLRSTPQSAASSRLAQWQQFGMRRRGYSGMIRVYCAAGISTMFLEDLDSTNRLAVMKRAIENAPTNDAHAN